MYMESVWKRAKEKGWDKILGFDYPGQALSCSEEEIKELEKEVNLKLPLAYKEFLRWAGNGLGSFETGSDFYYEQDLVHLQTVAKDLLEENKVSEKLPNDAFVFWGHHGYQFAFFCASGGDNPPVHYYLEAKEGEEEKIKWNYQPQFTDFLLVEMRDQARHVENAREIEARLARDWQNA